MPIFWADDDVDEDDEPFEGNIATLRPFKLGSVS